MTSFDEINRDTANKIALKLDKEMPFKNQYDEHIESLVGDIAARISDVSYTRQQLQLDMLKMFDALNAYDDEVHRLRLALYNCYMCRHEGDKIHSIVDMTIGRPGQPGSFRPRTSDRIW